MPSANSNAATAPPVGLRRFAAEAVEAARSRRAAPAISTQTVELHIRLRVSVEIEAVPSEPLRVEEEPVEAPQAGSHERTPQEIALDAQRPLSASPISFPAHPDEWKCSEAHARKLIDLTEKLQGHGVREEQWRDRLRLEFGVTSRKELEQKHAVEAIAIFSQWLTDLAKKKSH